MGTKNGSTASKSIPDDLEDIFSSCSEEKHVVPCTYSTTDKTDIDITGGQNANWTYGQFIIFNPQDQNKTVNSYKLNEDQYLIKKDGSEWNLYNKKGQVLATGHDAIRDFVKDVKRNGGKSSYGKKMVGIKQLPLQQIFYGAPGSGKSHKVNEIIANYPDTIRTTFHPDSDYASFVGSYKPVVELCDVNVVPVVMNNGIPNNFTNPTADTYKEKKISYKFVKQAFLKAYIKAWQKYAKYYEFAVNAIPNINSVSKSYSKGYVQVKSDWERRIGEDNAFNDIVGVGNSAVFAVCRYIYYEIAIKKVDFAKDNFDDYWREFLDKLKKGDISYTAKITTYYFKLNEKRNTVIVTSKKETTGEDETTDNVQDFDNRQYLVIEELNRGNCAQIFGDIFQLLDRKNGFSEYPIVPDEDIQNALCESDNEGLSFDGIKFSDEQKDLINNIFNDSTIADQILSGKKLVLPPNLYIWATMNTSDQSLFPMDSAFKRRWEWEYVPVDHEDAKRFHIFIGGKSYNWDTFISVVNKKIFGATQSADKQLGNRFCKPDATIGIDSDSVEHYMISTKQFMCKVMFYLWEEVCKDAPEEESINFMRICEKLNDPANPVSSEYFTFQELYEGKDYKKNQLSKEAILQMFMNYLNVPEETNISNINSSIGSLLDFEKTNTNNQDIEECDLGKILGTSDGGSVINNPVTEVSKTPKSQE